MPYKKKQLRKTKTKPSKSLIRKKEITSRLMAISLIHDDFIYYNKKPISVQDAEMYAKEMETYRKQSRDKRILQVIEKLTGFMKYIINENSAHDTDVVIDLEETIEGHNNDNQVTAERQYNAIEVELEKPISKISLADHRKPETNTIILDKIHKSEKDSTPLSTTAINRKTLNEVENHAIPNTITEKHGSISEFGKLINKTQYVNILRKLVSVNKANSRNNNTVVEDRSKLNTVIQDKIAGDGKKLLKNLQSNLVDEHSKSIDTVQRKTNTRNKQPLNHNKTSNNTACTGNKITEFNNIKQINNNTKLESKLLPSKQNEIVSDNSQPSQNLLNNFKYVNSTEVECLQSSKATNKNQHCHTNNITNIKNNTKCNFIKRTNNIVIEANPNKTTFKELRNDSMELSQNLLENYEYGDCTAAGVNKSGTNIKINTPKPNTATTFSDNKDTKKVPLKVKADDQAIASQPQNKIRKVKKQTKDLKKGIVKIKSKRAYNRKNKVTNINTEQNHLNKGQTANTIADAAISKTITFNSLQKEKRQVTKKARKEIDFSWVENMKYIRVIETEEYIKMDNLEESFWSDLSLPPNMSSMDFEYDTLNIWRS